ncbi:MAG: bifunctional ornithine acetyltransferase/N-acetylglutamate synthase, partial [Myxococcales bacterium]|nr:bifunctional ornithine acetyltransferase/N-acetylglutamate synthase [Myxococcales bacterium]
MSSGKRPIPASKSRSASRAKAFGGKALPVPGFRYAGVHCGVKQADLDLALIASEVPASVAGVFTRSTIVGAPVTWCRARAASGRARAVVANSGCANTAMGERGARDAASMASHVAKALGCSADEVFVASTGVIGEPLPMAAIRSGIRDAGNRLAASSAVEGHWRGLAQARFLSDDVAERLSTAGGSNEDIARAYYFGGVARMA